MSGDSTAYWDNISELKTMDRELITNQTIYLVTLNDAQIERAKEINGPRKKITHGLVCGAYGRLFGTEKQCRKHFDAWQDQYPGLFTDGIETDDYVITKYLNTPELGEIIANLHQALIESGRKPTTATTAIAGTKREFRGLFAKLLAVRSGFFRS